MKILLVGVFRFGSTDNWKLLALRRLGHRVVACPYREVPVREHFPIGEPFDLVLVSKGTPLSAEDFAHLATLGRARLLWWPDPFENWDEAHTAALRTGDWRCSATSHAVREKICNAVDAPDVPMTFTTMKILEGADCDGPHPEWIPERVEPALLHFGGTTPRRAEIISQLRDAGIRVDHLPRPLYGAHLQREVLRYAAVLGINSSPDLYSNRVQTVLAMGGRILQELAPGLLEDFMLPVVPRPLLPWLRVEDLVNAAHVAIEQPTVTDDRGDCARATIERHSWERAMERAIAFATGGDS